MTIETCLNTVKECKACLSEKPLDQFYKRKSSIDGREHRCITCRRTQMAKADAARYDSTKRRASHLLRSYVITPAIYEHLSLMQGEVCAICGSSESGRGDDYFVVDHCHTTGQVRGLLCHQCNTALGLFKDKTTSLQNAIAYLAQSTGSV
jgi:hypothetical protein